MWKRLICLLLGHDDGMKGFEAGAVHVVCDRCGHKSHGLTVEPTRLRFASAPKSTATRTADPEACTAVLDDQTAAWVSEMDKAGRVADVQLALTPTAPTVH